MSTPIIHSWVGEWRNVTSLCEPGVIGGGRLLLGRTREWVHWKIMGGTSPNTVTTGRLLSIPAEYQPHHQPWDRPTVRLFRHGTASGSYLGLGGTSAWADSLHVTGAGGIDHVTSGTLSYPCFRPLPLIPMGDPA